MACSTWASACANDANAPKRRCGASGAIARAVVCEPALLLDDEPTGALDSDSGEGVMRLLLDLHETALTTIVVITHERVVASHLPRQVSLLDGRVVDDQMALAP